MTTKKIHYSYTEIKQAYLAVMGFAKTEAPCHKEFCSKTTLENELGLYDLENVVFLENFRKKFHIESAEENDSFDSFIAFMYLFLLPAILLKWILSWLVYPFSHQLSAKIRCYSFKEDEEHVKKDVTIGDLVISLLRKEFSKRKDYTLEFSH